MTNYEYRVIPAPTKAKRGRFSRATATRFADRLQDVFNDMAKDGWDYVRTDTLPNEERTGLTTKTVTYRNLLVFRRTLPDAKTINAADRPALIEGTAHPQTMHYVPNAISAVPEKVWTDPDYVYDDKDLETSTVDPNLNEMLKTHANQKTN
ncbi:MAG: DUF4177 domain-containing protein [Pseudomonadota bacterium]